MMKMKSCVLTVLLLNIFFDSVASLYFNIADSDRKCFIQEVPDDTVVIGNFQIQLPDKQQGDLGMFVEAKGPDDELVLSQRLSSKGSFQFTSQKPGGHQICLQPDSSQRPPSAGGVLMVHLDIRVGERTNNYTEIISRDKLTELQLRVRQLSEQVLQIQKEQNYQRLREKRFHDVNHNTSMWIFWWPVVRSLYVVAIIIWVTNSW